MKENFDERLNNRIKDLFDNYQEAYQKENWEALKSRIEKKKKKTIVFWRQSLNIAAILIPVFALAAWYFVSLDFQDQNSGNAHQKIVVSDTVKDYLHQKQPLSAGNSQKNRTSSSKPELAPSFSESSTSVEGLPAQPKHQTAFEPIVHKKKNSTKAKNYNHDIVGIHVDEHREKATLSIGALDQKQNLILDLNQEVFQERILAQMNQALTDYFTLENPLISDLNKINYNKRNGSDKNKIAYGLGLTSMYNYTSESVSNSSLNYGGSLSTDIPIAKNFSISSGVMLSKQSFILEEPRLFTTSSVAAGSQDFQQTDINLLALDVPINLSYNFKLSKQKTFNLTAGVSSLVYLKENFTNNYSVTTSDVQFNALTAQPETVITTRQHQETDAQSAFGKFDFARLLNFSIGMSYPISSRFDLQFEPYIKYPIGALTHRNFRFGMGGIQLRLKIKK